MKHKSKNLLSRSIFLYFREKTKKIDADRILEKKIWSFLKKILKRTDTIVKPDASSFIYRKFNLKNFN